MRSGLHDSDVWSLYSVLHSLKSELKLLVFNGIHVIIDSELAMKNSCLWDKTRGDKNFIHTTHRKKDIKNDNSTYEALPRGGGMSHVARLNFKTSCVGVYKCLSLIVGFAVTVAIWPKEDVSCHDFILRVVATFWTMSLVRIYPGRVSLMQGTSHLENS